MHFIHHHHYPPQPHVTFPQQHLRGNNKLFAVEEQEHSRIYKALNPDKLWYESRRAREMAKEDDEDDDIDYKVRFNLQIRVFRYDLKWKRCKNSSWSRFLPCIRIVLTS